MKKSILFTFLLVTLSKWTFAQDTLAIDKAIEFSFNSSKRKNIIIPTKLRQSEYYQIVVHDINLNNYRVEIQVKDTVYYSSPLNFPVLGSIDISSIPTILPLVDVQAEDSLVTDPTTIQIKEKLDNSIYYLDGIISSLVKQRTDTEKLYRDFIKARILAKTAPMTPHREDVNIDEKIQKFESLQNSIDEIRTSFDTKSIDFNKFFQDEKVIKVLSENDTLKKSKEVVAEEFKKKEKNIAELQIQVNNSSMEKALVSVYQLYNTSTFTSLPIQFTGEEAEIKMSFIPKDSASNLQTYHLSPMKIGKSPWYWAVGPGMYYSKHENESAITEVVPVNDSTNNYKVTRQSNQKGEIGVSLLFRAGYKFKQNSSLNPGIHANFGTGVSVGENVQVRLMYGAGLSLGRKHNLTFDIGGATGHVRRIAEGITQKGPDPIYESSPELYSQKLSTKLFFGVGYMFIF